MILVGVDAGATTTRAVASEDGRLAGRATAGSGNPHNAGVGAAAEAIVQAVRRAAGGRAADLVVAGVAGLEDPRIKEGLHSALAASGFSQQFHISSDALIALDGAFLGGPGIIVISGTGSVAWGRNERGEEARSGGWGHVIDDAGSGYDIGRSVLRAVLRAHDGRGPATIMTSKVFETLGVRLPEQIVGAAREMSPPQMAALAPIALEAAAEGDAVAREILAVAGRELAATAEAVWRQLGFAGPHPVAGIGGVFSHAGMREAFVEALRGLCPEAVFTPPRLPPVGGALWRAFAMRGLRPPEALIRQVAEGDR
ncbi:MAG: BadF/BadG/BcrA/BcrD ATPase family protein [Armatimonadota bacterium]|nr:BadF/BadG/BcrA/BcrD ATPase family protein [Armatimonadota bacterium]MDR7450747.1 BadF/BadG/BcrA/BcrD ATPase family protein [Armatimonadota bacterium]MDR7466103.1 BadF/BadG/BcrA/BcrD ATPase family protein [Armatimonadota bacterium]MDR7493860.1 BadF/BadG/BcrA/BcrD ATPase family protein [Armatimonadota bacterium]MDR7498979.1 BadF/BadG/BcrA/BcrD ATPase family protein [Armatimonadota bacterium]